MTEQSDTGDGTVTLASPPSENPNVSDRLQYLRGLQNIAANDVQFYIGMYGIEELVRHCSGGAVHCPKTPSNSTARVDPLSNPPPVGTFRRLPWQPCELRDCRICLDQRRRNGHEAQSKQKDREKEAALARAAARHALESLYAAHSKTVAALKEARAAAPPSQPSPLHLSPFQHPPRLGTLANATSPLPPSIGSLAGRSLPPHPAATAPSVSATRHLTPAVQQPSPSRSLANPPFHPSDAGADSSGRAQEDGEPRRPSLEPIPRPSDWRRSRDGTLREGSAEAHPQPLRRPPVARRLDQAEGGSAGRGDLGPARGGGRDGNNLRFASPRSDRLDEDSEGAAILHRAEATAALRRLTSTPLSAEQQHVLDSLLSYGSGGGGDSASAGALNGTTGGASAPRRAIPQGGPARPPPSNGGSSGFPTPSKGPRPPRVWSLSSSLSNIEAPPSPRSHPPPPAPFSTQSTGIDASQPPPNPSSAGPKQHYNVKDGKPWVGGAGLHDDRPHPPTAAGCPLQSTVGGIRPPQHTFVGSSFSTARPAPHSSRAEGGGHVEGGAHASLPHAHHTPPPPFVLTWPSFEGREDVGWAGGKAGAVHDIKRSTLTQSRWLKEAVDGVVPKGLSVGDLLMRSAEAV